MSDARQYAVCSMAQSMVKVTSPWKLEILPFWLARIFFDICLSFYVTWLLTWQKRQLWRVADRQSRMGLILFCFFFIPLF